MKLMFFLLGVVMPMAHMDHHWQQAIGEAGPLHWQHMDQPPLIMLILYLTVMMGLYFRTQVTWISISILHTDTQI